MMADGLIKVVDRASERTAVNQLQSELSIPNFLARILVSRGVNSSSDIELAISNLLPPDEIYGVEEGAQRVVEAIENQQRIVVAGDFDADGATAAALCVSFLNAVGAESVDYAVPVRERDGYGLTPGLVQSICAEPVDLIITVDNGISSIQGVRAANAAGTDVVITDHHLPPKELPDATAIVNPNMPEGNFRSSPAGVGVAFYLMTVVRKILLQKQYFEKRSLAYPNMTQFLDLVAVGTIADLVPLDRNNRALVALGLARMRTGKCREAFRQLCVVNNVNIGGITEEDIGFRIAPCINAVGRLDDMKLGIKLLLEHDSDRARTIAHDLLQINQTRRATQASMSIDAFAAVQPEDVANQLCVCIYEQRFHEGVVGLVASQLVKEFAVPAIVFAENRSDSNQPPVLKGSARSIPGLHIRDLLADIASDHRQLMQAFGGHAMAAGLTIRKANFARFKSLFEQKVREFIDPRLERDTKYCDGELDTQEISIDTVELLDRYGPWGQQFESPLFRGTFSVLNERQIGKDLNHVQLQLHQNQSLFAAVAFNQSPVDSERALVLYRLSANSWRDNRQIQLIVEHMQAL